ncbi:MAG: hypothetical protein ACI9JD_003209 [Rhodococcus sp. (in: high G+C Gram-positive bacteria)]|jgi:hypothetical protein
MMAKAAEPRPSILTIVGPTGDTMEDRIFSPRDPDE